VNAEIVRNFSVSAFQKWLDYYETENLLEQTRGDMVENVGRILGKTIDLQQFIHLRAGLILKKLALLDMKLKQIGVLEDTIKNIEIHPADIHSNLGNNLLWKFNMEAIVDETASIHSGYQLAWNSICEVLGVPKDLAINPIVSAKHIAKPGLDKHYYPDQEFFKDPSTKLPDDRPVPSANIRADKNLDHGKKAMKDKPVLLQKSENRAQVTVEGNRMKLRKRGRKRYHRRH